MRNYMKNREEMKDLLRDTIGSQAFISLRLRCFKKQLLITFASLLLIAPLFAYLSKERINYVELSEESLMKIATAPVAATATGVRKGTITIPAGTVKANPFVPYRDLGDTSGGANVNDVPSYTLVEPPEMVNESSEAARVMDTVVSGILYDRYSPSAIINIEGNDYLVKKGDVVNNYKVLCIAQDSVTVKLGENTYKAGIGEILTEGTLHHNDVSNLNNKFGGVRE